MPKNREGDKTEIGLWKQVGCGRVGSPPAQGDAAMRTASPGPSWAQLCGVKPKATGAPVQAAARWDLRLLGSWLGGSSGDGGSCSSVLHWGEKIKNRNGLIFPSNSFSLFFPPHRFSFFGEKMTHFSAKPNFCKCQDFLRNRSPAFQPALGRNVSNQGICSVFSFLSYVPYASR